MEIGLRYLANIERLKTLSSLGVGEASRLDDCKYGCYICGRLRTDDFLCFAVLGKNNWVEHYYLHESCFVSLLELLGANENN
ncbi:MAG: hypothetical protein AABX11_04745 [Nanoarchaeota archaeon]